MERPRDVLAELSALVHERLAPVTVGAATEGGWIGLDHLLRDPRALAPLVAVSGGRRFRSDDWALVVAQVARESIQVLVTAAVNLWTRDRRLFDMSAANVVLREGPVATEVGLRRARLAVLADDPLAPAAGTDAEVEVVTEAQLLQRLVERVIGRSVPLGAVPRGPADQVAAVAAIVATVRRTVRSGQRHLWGTAGLAIGSTLASASHAIGERADRDRDTLFAARRDLARTVDLTTVDDALGGTVTFALRRTCCLLLKLPDEAQCGTCSLRDHDACVARMTDWHRVERRRRRSTT
ncbi:MAG TPA: hypothetical protein VGO78_07675 [Acidimicrobiales bacterium]|nr:hypothetical protein [Acidimicrobiales bacterium]